MRGLVSAALTHRVTVVALDLLLVLLAPGLLRETPFDVFPEFAPPLVEIQTEAPGLSTEEVEQLVTVPLENALLGTSWVRTLRSKSVLGLSSVVLLFPPGTDLRLSSAMMGFALFEAAYYSEIIRAGIQSVTKGQVSAGLALGLTPGQTMRLIVLPQAFRNMLPLLLTQGIILFQDTSLVYVIGLSDFFGTSYKVGDRDGRLVELLLFAGAVYFVICFSVSRIVKRLQARFSQ